MVADTPLWNAEQDQIADLVDFLTAHMGELNEVKFRTFCNFDVAHLTWFWTSIWNVLPGQTSSLSYSVYKCRLWIVQ